jgi:hypothetical protein
MKSLGWKNLVMSYLYDVLVLVASVGRYANPFSGSAWGGASSDRVTQTVLLMEEPLTLALGDIATLGGLALQAEDCAIRAALHHRGEHGGLVHMENERYHQCIIWRAILPIWHAVLEREESTDIIISKDGIKHYFELKNWRGT